MSSNGELGGNVELHECDCCNAEVEKIIEVDGFKLCEFCYNSEAGVSHLNPNLYDHDTKAILRNTSFSVNTILSEIRKLIK